MKKIYQKHREKINYLLVGGWNTLFGYLVFVALYYLLSARIHYLIIFILSNIIGITNAYVGYKTFVFRTKGNILREYLRFYLVYGGAILINLAALPLIVEGFHLSPLIAQAFLTFITVIISYFGHKNFSFGPRTPDTY